MIKEVKQNAEVTYNNAKEKEISHSFTQYLSKNGFIQTIKFKEMTTTNVLLDFENESVTKITGDFEAEMSSPAASPFTTLSITSFIWYKCSNGALVVNAPFVKTGANAVADTIAELETQINNIPPCASDPNGTPDIRVGGSSTIVKD